MLEMMSSCDISHTKSLTKGVTQPVFTCSKSTMEISEKWAKPFQS